MDQTLVFCARFFRIVCVIGISLGLAACPKKRQVLSPKTTVTLPTNGDSDARSRFEMSRNRFEQNAEVDTGEEFEAIVRDYPDDPIVPHALLYAAMADLRKGDGASAQAKISRIKSLEGVDAAVVTRVTLLNGFAFLALGQKSQAFSELKAGQSALDNGDAAEVSAWHAGMGESAAASGQAELAIEHYDQWWSTASEAEKAYASDQIETLLTKVGDSKLRGLYSRLESRKGPAAARIAPRLIALLEQSEDAQAAELLAAIQETMRSIGLDSGLSGQAEPGNPDIVGALMPMTGRLNRVGELSMRALVLASGQSSRAGDSARFQLLARDTNSNAALVSEGMESLVQSDAVAIVGPFDARALKSAVPLALRHRIPLISLAPRGSSGNNVFSIRHSAEARARLLARHAYGQGVRNFAVFAPTSSYGKVVGRAFRLEVEKLGATVVVSAEYPKGSTSLKSHVAKLRKPWTAVFVPDLAKQLQLVAPALAAANFHARAVGGKSKRGRSILLLSTAEGIDANYLRAAGRYSAGAVFAPGFYPDRTDNHIADFVLRYEKEFGVEPGAHEAYAYDAAMVVRQAVNAGAFSRDAVTQELYRQSNVGQTGTIAFDSRGRRSDKGLLFEVTEPIVGQHELSAIR